MQKVRDGNPKNKKMHCSDCDKEISRSRSYHQTTSTHQFKTRFAEPQRLNGKKEKHCEDCLTWFSKYHKQHSDHVLQRKNRFSICKK